MEPFPSLLEEDLLRDPVAQFAQWFGEAQQKTQMPMPEAMTLCTATKTGKPSARIVLLKHFDRNGFIFFTNFRSRKGQEIAENPWGALLFYWPDIYRQVRLEGRILKIPPADSDEYFSTRPRASQIGAWASPQSRPVVSMEMLCERVMRYSQQFDKKPVPRPPHWGGYRLVPQVIQFWQSGSDRLHDSFRYSLLRGGMWKRERIAP